jgi:sensor histidine kinase regulating citrate/malate metabolism
MSLFWRSWVTVTALIITVLAVLAALSTIQFDAILSNFIQGRLSVLAQTTQAPFQSATDLGLSLSSVRNAQALLERARQTDFDISAVHVFDKAGTIIHSTDKDHPTSVRAEVLFTQSESKSATWHAETGQHFLSGVTILDPAGETLGGVLVVYPKTELDTAVGAMAARLALYIIITLVVVAGIGIVVLRFGLRRLIQVFTGIDAVFATIERREWRRLAKGANAAPHPVRGFGIDTGNLEQMLRAAEDRYIAAGKELAALETGSDERNAKTAGTSK